jgi:hypothetical protein
MAATPPATSWNLVCRRLSLFLVRNRALADHRAVIAACIRHTRGRLTLETIPHRPGLPHANAAFP